MAIAPWEGCPCGNDHVHIQVVRQFMGCNACNNKGWTGEIPNMSVCDSCEGKGNRELPPMNSMIYPMISHLKPRGLYVTPGIQGSELGPGIVKSYAGVVGKTGITITLNYP